MKRKSNWHAFSGAMFFTLTLSLTIAHADIVNYNFEFDSTWAAETHPGAFPPNAHYSGTVVATHNSDYSMWVPGGMSTFGVQRIAEAGASGPLVEEINAAIANGSAERVFTVPGLGTTPARDSGRIQANSTHPLISFASMIAPSPDWIVGAHDVSLVDEVGNWIPEIVIDVLPYDAGTDSGADFTSANLASDPHVPIFRITEAPFDGENSAALGSFTITLESLPGDFNGSGVVDADEIDVLCYRLGQSHPNFELSGDDVITMDDVTQLVERVIGTRPGDSNLDGKVNFEDFLNLSANFDQPANWTGGDFDCSRHVDFADFLELSRNFGFGEEGEVASAPEPSGILLLMAAACMAGSTRRRR